MMNKLFLSSVLLTFERDSISQVATALIFSIARHVIYAVCNPHTLDAAVHLQHIVLSMLTMTYFLGLLLKVRMAVYITWCWSLGLGACIGHLATRHRPNPTRDQ
jgi:hypothetical protein